MKSFQELYTEIQDQTFDTSAAGLVVIKRRINDGIRQVVRLTNGVFLDKTKTSTTDADGIMSVPVDFGKLIAIVVANSATQNYNPQIITGRSEWNRLNASSYSSDYTSHVFIENKQLYLWPTPASTGKTVTLIYKRIVKDLIAADYTSGTVTATNNSTTITGVGTTFTAAMVGRYIKLPDGFWYEIASYTSATSITISGSYEGTTTAGATFTIGEMSVIPEGHEDVIIDYVLWKHYMRISDRAQANDYKQSFYDRVKLLKTDFSSWSTNVVIDDGMNSPSLNPNLFINFL